MRPVFNAVPKCRVTFLTREEWIRGPDTPPVVKGLVWYTDRSRMLGGARVREYGQSLGRRLSICPEKYAVVFHSDIYAILAVHEIQINDTQGKYISIYSDTRRL
jgi:hypothetical protein